MNATATKNKPESIPAKQEQGNVETAPAIRILKVGSAPTLSGGSTLSYQVGCDAESNIYFKVIANSGTGYFNSEWSPMESIGKALGDSNKITSFSLKSIFKGKSNNNGGFLLAILKQEGLVVPSEEIDRCYQLGDPSKFMAEVKALIESGVSLDADAKPKKSSKKKSASEPAPSAE